jgi:hypothetical protein
MGYVSKSLNDWRDDALRIATEHGFKDASIGEDIALMHSELSEALEDHRAGKDAAEVWYETIENGQVVRCDRQFPEQIVPFGGPPRGEHVRWANVAGPECAAPPRKPCGVPSEMADVIIRILHFCGKHKIDIEQAVREKMLYNESRPMRHGGKAL